MLGNKFNYGFFKTLEHPRSTHQCRTYMSFINWQASVDYYKKWQDKFYTNHSENYYDFLKRIKYARSPHYIKVLKLVKARTAQ